MPYRNIWGCQPNTLWALLCVQFQKIGINKEKEICMPNKESISGPRCERTKWLSNVKSLWIAVKFQSNLKNKFAWQKMNTWGIFYVKEQIWLTNVEYLKLSN